MLTTTGPSGARPWHSVAFFLRLPSSCDTPRAPPSSAVETQCCAVFVVTSSPFASHFSIAKGAVFSLSLALGLSEGFAGQNPLALPQPRTHTPRPPAHHHVQSNGMRLWLLCSSHP